MIKELNYDLTKEDLMKGLGTINSLSNNSISIIQIVGFIIIVFLAILTGVFSRDYLFPVFIIVFFTILMFLSKGKKSFVKILGKYETQTFNLIINSDENTFINKNDISTTVINWNKVLKIDNTKDSMLIYTTTSAAIIIPKRIFETEQEMNETWELIQECYNKYKEN